MTKAEKTRAFIIEQAAPVFNTKGYSETSLTDIIQATGLTKGAIYGNFTDKNEMTVAVYEYHISRILRSIAAAMSDKVTAYDKLVGFCTFYRDNWQRIFENGGCPMQNAAVEADDHLAFLKVPVQRSIKKCIKNLAIVIEQGQQDGSFRMTADAQHYAATFITIVEGGIMMGKIMNDHCLLFAALDRIMQITNEELKC